MVITIFIAFHHIHQQPGQIKSIRRRPNLVIDDADRIMSLTDIEHGFDEILAILTEYPGNADDEIFLQRL